MEVQLSPSTVPAEEHGYLLGDVISVSQFPATAQGMYAPEIRANSAEKVLGVRD